MTRLFHPMHNSRGITLLRTETMLNFTNGTKSFFPHHYVRKPNFFHFSRLISSNVNDNFRRRSPYSVLQIKTSATEKEIKESFRNLAKKYHPDLNPNKSIDEPNRMTE